MHRLPTIPPELAKALDKLIPPRCPAVTETDREIWLYAGKRALVEYLLAEERRQATDINHGSAVPS